PIQHLVPAQYLAHVGKANYAVLTGRSFFSHLIAHPFESGLHEAFLFAIVACLVAAAASWSRGKRYVDTSGPTPAPVTAPGAPAAQGSR
ncbi:MAG TPA: MFS transporter, partial [Acidimicrobiales bacterium]|nr:MFS transporter [Acidimicrobiales bacterium]